MAIKFRNSASPSSSAQETEVSLGRPLPVQIIDSGNSALATRIDDATATVSYIGKAAVGSLTSSAVWQVFKIDTGTSPQTIITFADGNSSFDNVWDDRASLSYS